MILVWATVLGFEVMIMTMSGLIGDQMTGSNNCLPLNEKFIDCSLSGIMNLKKFLVQIIILTMSTGPYIAALLFYLKKFFRIVPIFQTGRVQILIVIILCVWAIFQVQLLGIIGDKIFNVDQPQCKVDNFHSLMGLHCFENGLALSAIICGFNLVIILIIIFMGRFNRCYY